MTCRTVQAEGFVGSLVVEHATEVVEQLLLAVIVVRRIDDGALEERLVEPLMPGVVLGMTGTVVDRLNAVLHQSHADLREPSLTGGAKGRAVVRMHDVRQAVFAEDADERQPRLFG